MKKILLPLCFMLLLCGCTKNDVPAEESTTDTAAVTESEYASAEGRFLRCKNGSVMIIIEGTGPCTISEGTEFLKDFTEGDLVKIEFDGEILETYPGQITAIYGAELVEEGNLSDIDEETLSSLREMDWIE